MRGGGLRETVRNQYSTLIINQHQTPLAEFLQRRLDLVVPKLDDPLLEFVDQANHSSSEWALKFG